MHSPPYPERARARLGAAALLALFLPVCAVAQPALLDPATQPKFVNIVPDAMAPGFIYTPAGSGYDYYEIGMYQIEQDLGLIDPATGAPLLTTCWGYGTGPGFPNATYPGRTIVAQSGRQVQVKWTNNLTEDGTENGTPLPHLLPVDETLHWCYSLPGWEVYQLATDGVPVVPHVHGGHTEWQSDGNPEYFFTPGYAVKGPRWVHETYRYDNDQQAGTIWYHDHGLGITRLNVYAGLAGFYIIRDDWDTGLVDNGPGLPVWPYEQALVIQDHMFDVNGQHFYPSAPGDPLWDDFMAGIPNPPIPSALAEFFGDFILVNGVAWPKMDVEPRVYRLRLLNGSDSRVYKLWLTEGVLDVTVPINVIGNDDGLLYATAPVEKLVIAPGERYDVLVDFSAFAGSRIVVKNNARGPYPAGATVDPQTAGQIMAFDVGMTVTDNTNSTVPGFLRQAPITTADILQGQNVAETRRLALYEGMDNFGRLQPLLGTAEPVTDVMGGTQDGALVWDECRAPITENPALDTVEIWEVYNTTGDAHPFHVHLVTFQILDRQRFKADILPKDIVQHDGTIGLGFSMANIKKIGKAKAPDAYEAGWKDTAVMLPGEVTRIMARFDRPGRYVYHCHILSHEDHEMMRPYHVGTWSAELDNPYDCAGHGKLAGATPASVASLGVTIQPNPTSAGTRVSFALARAAHVRLAVYDIQGRLVNVILEGERDSGEHTAIWNGLDRSGSRVASGTYFARIETSVGSEVHKLVLMK